MPARPRTRAAFRPRMPVGSPGLRAGTSTPPTCGGATAMSGFWDPLATLDGTSGNRPDRLRKWRLHCVVHISARTSPSTTLVPESCGDGAPVRTKQAHRCRKRPRGRRAASIGARAAVRLQRCSTGLQRAPGDLLSGGGHRVSFANRGSHPPCRQLYPGFAGRNELTQGGFGPLGVPHGTAGR
jgi:hypothetical protein